LADDTVNEEAVRPMDEDDDMHMPTAHVGTTLSYRAPGGGRAPAKRDPLKGKQTLIPVTLTLGVLLPALFVVGRLAEADTAFVVFRNGWVPWALLAMGVLSIGTAALLMFQVKQALDLKAQEQQPQPAQQ